MATTNQAVLQAVVTDAGLAAASIATPTGPWVNLVSFSVGSASGYDAQKTDTGLQGTTLYQAPITGYMNVPPKTLQLQCVLPPTAGPFEFGELAVWLPDNVLFCKLVFPTPQVKTSSLITNVASQFTFNVLINLSQGTAIFQITSEILERIQIVGMWSDILPKSQMADQNIEEIIVQELDNNNNSSLLTLASQSKWTLGTNYSRLTSTSIGGASLTTVDIASTLATATPLSAGWSAASDQSGVAFELNGTALMGLDALGNLTFAGNTGLAGASQPNGTVTDFGNGFTFHTAASAFAIEYNGAPLLTVDSAGNMNVNPGQNFTAYGIPSQGLGQATTLGNNWSVETSAASLSIMLGSTALMTISAAGQLTTLGNIVARGNPLAVLGASNMNSQLLTNVNRQYVIEFPQQGLYRSASSLVDLGNGNYRFTLNPAPLPSVPNVGAPIVIYTNSTAAGLSTATQPGLVRPGVGLTIDTPGVLSARGMLHDAPGTGTIVNAAWDFNIGWNSGVYTVNGAITGGSYPANKPTGHAYGRLYVSNDFGVIHQRWVPSGDNTALEYSRSWVAATGWSPWRAATTNNPNATSVSQIVRLGFEGGWVVDGNNSYDSGTLGAMYDYYVVNFSDCDASVYINGTQVADIGVGPVGTDAMSTFACSIGDRFQVISHGGGWTNYVYRRQVYLA